VLLVVMPCGLEAKPPAKRKVDYNFQIRPLLADRCFACHGPDEKKRKADLRLDTPDGAREAGVIEPGRPDQSELIRRITATDESRMPPRKAKVTLSPAEIDLLRRWVAEGAEYKPHWAFVPLPNRVVVPMVSDPGWPRGALDCFTLARLDQEELKPSPSAAREDWIRRATFDLTGLPPTPAEVNRFLADRSATAYEKVVDRLLASPRFGERMAQDWLDVARYADSFGYQSDADNYVWPWRDWVIEAFNHNLPYDQFITWQIAGDLLERPTRSQRLATTFCRLHRMTGEGGSIAEEFRNEYVSDRIHTVGTAFLGLTLECTRCHDHKYDPLTMKDYYGLGAFFNSIDEWGTYDNPYFRPTPTLQLPTPEQEKTLATLEQEVAARAAKVREIETGREQAFRAWLKRPDLKAEIPGLVGYYPLDQAAGNHQLANLADASKPGTTSAANAFAPGKRGQALRFTGDDPADFPGVGGSFDRADPSTVAFWLRTERVMKQAIVFHRQAGTDTGFHGTELSFDEGRLVFAMIRFWPGNALAVRTPTPLAAGQWIHVAITYDGSGRAAGVRIYLNGRPAALDVVRDCLVKNLEVGGNGLTFGQRFRSTGLKDGRIDELRIYGRVLAPVEVAHIYDGKALADALVHHEAETLRPYYLEAVDAEAARAHLELRQARQRLFAAQTGIFEIMTMEKSSQTRQAYILARGRYDAPKNRPVGRLTPAALLTFPKEAPSNRVGLARWLTHPRHPLTARVAVNRVWQLFFGLGIVATTENFGTQGALPTHPELLDSLARDLITSGWNFKRLCKQIVLSATYRQRSAAFWELRGKDPDNLLLARGPARRLSAEMLRDSALAAGGLLVSKIGGPPTRPYQPPGLWRGMNAFLPAYVPDQGEGLYRRSLYTFWRRTSPPPNMMTFDAPTREVCVVRRASTSTPLQPLVLLNDPQFVEAARGLGERMLTEGGASAEERLTFAFRQAASRHPSARELALLKQLYTVQRTLFHQEPAAARKYLQIGKHPARQRLDPVELAAAAVTVSAILNLDAALMTR
jgi:hypothetical protein